MHFNLDEAIRGRGDWDFTIHVGGEKCATREVGEEEFRELQRLMAAGDGPGALRLLGGFFVNAPAGLEQWTTEQVTGVVTALATYSSGRMRRFAESVERHVEALAKGEERRK